MTSTAENNKRIARNTAMLYLRMLLTMVVSLYTSRITLQILGIDDYGIYNVVGGIVVFLSFLNTSLNAATQRYMNFEMGRKNTNNVRHAFSTSIKLYFLIGIGIIIISETLGLWIVKNILVIPVGSLYAALWVYQCSIVTFFIGLITVPYNSAIIAYERMSIFAYISIIDVGLKLLLVFLLFFVNCNKLILYAVLMTITQIVIFLIYRSVCIRKFPVCRVEKSWDKNLLKGIFSFSGWMLAGSAGNILSTQGVNLLINIYFGPALNAARGIAVQIYCAAMSLMSNFMTAVRPQIVKTYAEGELKYSYHLVFSSSRLSFYLLLIISLPILLNAKSILHIWLTDVPPYTVIFTQLIVLDALFTSSNSALSFISQASGKVKGYQSVITVSYLLITILTWCAYSQGMPVAATFVITIIIDFLGLFARLIVLRKTMAFPSRSFLKNVYIPVMRVFIISIVLTYIPYIFIKTENLVGALLAILWCVCSCLSSIWYFGLDKGEKNYVAGSIQKVLRRCLP